MLTNSLIVVDLSSWNFYEAERSKNIRDPGEEAKNNNLQYIREKSIITLIFSIYKPFISF